MLVTRVGCVTGAVGVRAHAEDDSPQTGKNGFSDASFGASELDLIVFLFQGPEFIQFLQQEYLPSLQVTPDISQVRQTVKVAGHQTLTWSEASLHFFFPPVLILIQTFDENVT